MWYRLQQVSWIFVVVLLLGSGTSVVYAAQYPVDSTSKAAASGSDFSKFAGTWIAHGALMTVSSNGHVNFEARTYNWCGPNVSQPCDSIEKDQIFYGYHEQLLLSSSNDAIAHGSVVSSNNASNGLNTAITLVVGPNDTLIYTNNGSVTFLCGPQAPAGTCGA